MKDGFRQCMAWLHTWTGLVVGWVLYFVFVTGTAGYFYSEIDRWMKPEMPLSTPYAAPAQALTVAQAHLQQRAPTADSWNISLQGGRNNPNLSVSWREAAKPGAPRIARKTITETLDPQSGETLGHAPRDTGGGFRLYRMHYQLHYLNYDTAVLIVGFCTMIMLVAIITGVITHKKIFKDFFTFRPAKGQRSWLDAHNVISVTALPFFLMITYSGLVFFLFNYMPAGVASVYGVGQREVFYGELYARGEQPKRSGVEKPLSPLTQLLAAAENVWGPGEVRSVTVQMPGDAQARTLVFRRDGASLVRAERLTFDVKAALIDRRETDSAAKATQDVMLALHEGRFAGPALRWLYFVSGALGALMIATGLVLWTVKRRPQQLKAGRTSFGYGLVERLNLATIAGLPCGIAAYFWANRLIPVDIGNRAAWEVHTLFIVWALAFAHAALRPTLRGWLEQLGAASLLFTFLPLLNALTTDRHLGVTLPHGDAVLAGFDLTMLAFGVLFAAAAIKVHRRQAVAPQGRARKLPQPESGSAEPA